MSTEPLLLRQQRPGTGTAAAAAYGAAPVTQSMVHEDKRSVHEPSIDTSIGSFFFYTTPLAAFLGCLCLPLTLLSMPVTVSPRHEAVGTVFGRYVGTWRDAGLYFINPCGLRLQYVNVNNRAYELAPTKVADSVGNSLVVAAVITFRIVDAARAVLDIESLDEFVRVQAHAILKRICSLYPYISYDGTPSLMTEASHLSEALRSQLQEAVAITGVIVISFQLSDLAYAKEIASQMLARQQAHAIIDARKTIVSGAVGIIGDALQALEDQGNGVSDGREKLITNLLTVLCSERAAVPTIDM